MKFLLYLNIFTTLCPLAIFFPILGRIYFNILMLIITYLLYKAKGVKKDPVILSKYVYIMIAIYLLSRVQHLWIGGVTLALNFWIPKLILFYLMTNIIENEKDIQRAIWAILLSTAVLTKLGWDMYLYHPELMENVGRLQSVANYNLSNSFGLLLTVTWPLGFFLIESEKNLIKRLLLIAILCSNCVAIIYTKSRGSMIGFGFAFILSVILSRKMFKKKLMKMLTLGIGLVLFFSFAVAIILSRPEISSFSGGYGEEELEEGRLMAWRAAIMMAKDHPILGVGWGQFDDNWREYGLPRHLITHNTPLNVLAETGVFGFYVFVYIMYHSLKQLNKIRHHWKNKEQIQKLYLLTTGIFIALASFNVNTQFSCKDHDPSLWVTLGIVGAVFQIHNRYENACLNGRDYE